jgi:hypothetical protein
LNWNVTPGHGQHVETVTDTTTLLGTSHSSEVVAITRYGIYSKDSRRVESDDGSINSSKVTVTTRLATFDQDTMELRTAGTTTSTSKCVLNNVWTQFRCRSRKEELPNGQTNSSSQYQLKNAAGTFAGSIFISVGPRQQMKTVFTEGSTAYGTWSRVQRLVVVDGQVVEDMDRPCAPGFSIGSSSAVPLLCAPVSFAPSSSSVMSYNSSSSGSTCSSIKPLAVCRELVLPVTLIKPVKPVEQVNWAFDQVRFKPLDVTPTLVVRRPLLIKYTVPMGAAATSSNNSNSSSRDVSSSGSVQQQQHLPVAPTSAPSADSGSSSSGRGSSLADMERIPNTEVAMQPAAAQQDNRAAGKNLFGKAEGLLQTLAQKGKKGVESVANAFKLTNSKGKKAAAAAAAAAVSRRQKRLKQQQKSRVLAARLLRFWSKGEAPADTTTTAATAPASSSIGGGVMTAEVLLGSSPSKYTDFSSSGDAGSRSSSGGNSSTNGNRMPTAAAKSSSFNLFGFSSSGSSKSAPAAPAFKSSRFNPFSRGASSSSGGSKSSQSADGTVEAEPATSKRTTFMGKVEAFGQGLLKRCSTSGGSPDAPAKIVTAGTSTSSSNGRSSSSGSDGAVSVDIVISATTPAAGGKVSTAAAPGTAAAGAGSRDTDKLPSSSSSGSRSRVGEKIRGWAMGCFGRSLVVM